MSIRCVRCKRIIISEQEHEFCVWAKRPPKISLHVEPIGGSEPPHMPQKIPMPTQKPIKHNIAPKNSKPPVHNIYSHDALNEETITDGRQDVARKIMEHIDD